MSVPNLDVAVPRDDLDDLLDADLGGDEVFRELDTNIDVPELPPSRSRPVNPTTDLGIDSEIKINKQRRPIAKLDEARLLSANGIPKLRRITKERLKFKGKGHEFSDVARLLNLYQLWLDDLFPKAKFVDGLALIEKTGHSKRMQIMRREWIDEGKPRNREEEHRQEAVKAYDAKQQNVAASEPESRKRETSVPAAKAANPDVVMSGALNTGPQEESLFVSDDDERMGSSRPQSSKADSGAPHKTPNPQNSSTNNIQLDKSLFFSDREAPKVTADEDLDDLDALLAEEEQMQKENAERSFSGPTKPQARIADEFEDEMEAMAGFDDW